MSTLVLVTESEFRRAERVFQSAPELDCVPAPDEEQALAATVLAKAARYVVVGHRPYRTVLYDAVPRGGVIARFGVGTDNLDLGRATAAGVLCTNTPGVLDQSVAEQTMLLIAAAARHVVAMATDMANELWALRQGVELQGKTLAIIGCGRIGRAVARIATRGYDMRVIGCRRAGGSALDQVLPDFAAVVDDFATAVQDADFVSLHIPAQTNVGYVTVDRLAHLRPHAWLINTARGAVMDERALYDALAGSRLGGAALDVFAQEPYVPADPSRDLRTLPNVVLTPHIGSHTIEANRRMAERALANIAFAHSGQFASMNLLNPNVMT